MSQDKEEAFFNRSLERALCILNAFDGGSTAFTLAQLAEKVNLSRSTVLRLCSTLVKYNFLRREVESKRYSLGLRLFELGSLAFYSFTLRKISTHFLSQLEVKMDRPSFLEFLEGEELKQENQRRGNKKLIGSGEKICTRTMRNRTDVCRGTRETAARTRADATLGELICACVILKPSATLTGEEIVARPGKEGATEQQLPWTIEFVEELPRMKVKEADKRTSE